ncbi:MAG: hypothetical protein E2O39_14925 [Planctomycetota bacterium]|nr:MAG: hypothetical protein E2O39_14925 [Planctomycetota bacterium]
MTMHRTLPLPLLAFVALQSAQQARAQCQLAELEGADTAAGDRHGVSVDIDGERVIVGASRDDDNGETDSGSAYVYVRQGATWVQEAKVTAGAFAGGNYHFGQAVAISADTAVVGSPDDDDVANKAGSVYVFTRQGTLWTQQAKLVPLDVAAGDRFGWAVDIDGDVIVVGSKFDDDGVSNSGSAYVYRRSGTTWAQETKLHASDPASIAQFGDAVAIDGDTIVVGAWQDDGPGTGAFFFSGAAYAYRYDGANWNEEAKLVASDAESFHWLGRSVAVDGDTVLAGAFGHGVGGCESGAAYVFTRAGTVWTQADKLVAADAVCDDRAGWSVGVAGDVALVGAYHDDDGGGDAGSVYAFERSGTVWTETNEVLAIGGAAGDELGYSLSLAGARAVVGAWLHDGAGASSGRALVYDVGQDSDCNGNGVCDAVDIATGVSSDTNGNGIPDECETVGTPYCFGDGSGAACPCGNTGGTGQGCLNSTGSGAVLSGGGSASVAADDLVLSATNLPATQFGILYMGPDPTAVPFGDGLRCIDAGALGFHRFPVRNAGPGGTIVEGPGVVAFSLGNFPTAGHIASGSTWNFQAWFRDPGGPCSNAFELSNGLAVAFVP